MTTPQELSDEAVRFTIHHKPACIAEYDVEASAQLAVEARRKALKKVAKEVSLPGFRKGRVPDELVAKNFSKEIDKQWESEIASSAFEACQKLSSLRPLRNNKVQYKMKTFSQNGALCTLIFETEPTVPAIDITQLELKPVPRPDVNEEKVQETIRQIRLFLATWEKPTDRVVAEGDFVLLDVVVTEDDPPTPLFTDTRFEVAPKSMAQWMYDLVLGKSIGEVCDGVSVPDETASAEEKETLGPKKVRLTIKSIDVPTIPPINQDFLIMLGVSSEEELHTNITKLLNTQADAHVQEALRAQVNDFLLNKCAFELPATLIMEETRFRFEQLAQDRDFQNYWSGLSKEERNKAVQMISTQAEKAVRLFYLCRKIVSDAHISISAEDVPPSASTALELLLNPQKIHHHQRTPEVEHAEAYSRILLEKAEDYLIAQAGLKP